MTYEQKKMYPEAVAEWQTVVQLSGNPAAASLLGESYKNSGYQGFLQASLDGSLKAPVQSLPSWRIASLYAQMGKKKEALTWLEKAYAERGGGMVRLKSDPEFDSLRSEPGFLAIIRRINFPD
jgi:uncharacterized protein YfaS (alpha-2-macroglobulin family)